MATSNERWEKAGGPEGVLPESLPGIQLEAGRWAVHLCFSGRFPCEVQFCYNGEWRKSSVLATMGDPSAATIGSYNWPAGYLGLLVKSGSNIVPPGDQLADGTTKVLGFGVQPANRIPNAVVIVVSRLG
jgi:hypothetical protein